MMAVPMDKFLCDHDEPTKTIYTVAYSASIGALAHEVNGLLLDGWQLQGGVSVSTRAEAGADRHLFAQALTKAVPR